MLPAIQLWFAQAVLLQRSIGGKYFKCALQPGLTSRWRAPCLTDLYLVGRHAMGLYDTFGKAAKPDSNPGVRPIELYMCSVVKRMGYADGELRCSDRSSHGERNLSSYVHLSACVGTLQRKNNRVASLSSLRLRTTKTRWKIYQITCSVAVYRTLQKVTLIPVGGGRGGCRGVLNKTHYFATVGIGRCTTHG